MREAAFRIATALLLASAAWGFGRAAVAGPGRPSLILLVPAEQDDTARAAVTALSSQLSDLEADLAVTPVAALPTSFGAALEAARGLARPSGVAAILWVVDVGDEAAVLYLFEGDGARALMRRVEGEGAAARFEAAAVIARMSIDELLRGGRVGVAVEPAPAPKPPASAAAPREPETRARRSGWLRPSAAYALTVRSADHPAVQGLDIACAAAPSERVELFAGYTVLERVEDRGGGVTLTLSRHPFRFGARGVFRWSLVELGVALAIVMDWTTFEADLDPGLSPVRDRADFVLGALPSVDFGVAPVRWLAVFASIGAEIDLPSRSYGFDRGGGRVVLVDTWRAQPWLLAGVAVRVP
jgi:hypothetical protein